MKINFFIGLSAVILSSPLHAMYLGDVRFLDQKNATTNITQDRLLENDKKKFLATKESVEFLRTLEDKEMAMFGSEPADKKIQKKVHKALLNLGVKDASGVPVYIMPSKYGYGLATTRAIWICPQHKMGMQNYPAHIDLERWQKAYLNQTIHHEAVHWAKNHTWKTLLYSNMRPEQYEKEADTIAVFTMCDAGKKDDIKLIAQNCDRKWEEENLDHTYCANVQEAFDLWKKRNNKEKQLKAQLFSAML